MMRRADWKKQIDDVTNWILTAGYTLRIYTGADDQVDFDMKEVHINSRLRPENRFYTMLHEYGHIEISVKAAKQFESDHPMYVRSGAFLGAMSQAARVSVVAEEFEAWRRGRTRARKEGLFIDDKKYDKQITQYMMAYIDWAAR